MSIHGEKKKISGNVFIFACLLIKYTFSLAKRGRGKVISEEFERTK